MFHEIAFAGLLFSPLVIFVPLALMCFWTLQWAMHVSGLRQQLWQPAWFDISLIVLSLGFVVWLFSDRYF